MSLYKGIGFALLMIVGVATPATELYAAAASSPDEAFSVNRPLTGSERERVVTLERDVLDRCFDKYISGRGTVTSFARVKESLKHYFKDFLAVSAPEKRSENIRQLTHVRNNLCTRFFQLHATNKALWEKHFGLFSSAAHSQTWGRADYFGEMLDYLESLINELNGTTGHRWPRPRNSLLVQFDLTMVDRAGGQESITSSNGEAIKALLDQDVTTNASHGREKAVCLAGSSESAMGVGSVAASSSASSAQPAAAMAAVTAPVSAASKESDYEAAIAVLEELRTLAASSGSSAGVSSGSAACAASASASSEESSTSGITLRLKQARPGPYGQKRYFALGAEPAMEDGASAHSVGASHAKVNQARTCEGLVLTPDSLGSSHPVFKKIERAQEMHRRAEQIFWTRRREPNTGPGVDQASEPQALSAASSASASAAGAFAELYEAVEGHSYEGPLHWIVMKEEWKNLRASMKKTDASI